MQIFPIKLRGSNWSSRLEHVLTKSGFLLEIPAKVRLQAQRLLPGNCRVIAAIAAITRSAPRRSKYLSILYSTSNVYFW